MVYFSNIIWWFSFPEISPVSGFFSGFSSKFQISDDWMIVYLSDMIRWFSFPEIYPVSGSFPNFFQTFFKSLDFSWLNDSLLVKYDMMLLFPRNLSGIRIFSDLQIIDILFIKYDMMIFFSGNYPVFSVFFWILNFFSLFYWFWPELHDNFFGFCLDLYLFKAFNRVYSAHEVGL